MSISNAKLVLPSVTTLRRLARYHKNPTATHTKNQLNAALIDLGCTIIFPFKIATFFLDKVFENIMVKDIALKAVSDAEVDFDDMVSAFSSFVDHGHRKLVDRTLAQMAKLDSGLTANLTSEIYYDRTLAALDAFYEKHDKPFIRGIIDEWSGASRSQKLAFIGFLGLFNVLAPPLFVLRGLKNYFQNMLYLRKQFGIIEKYKTKSDLVLKNTWLANELSQRSSMRVPMYNVWGFLGRIGFTLGMISLIFMVAKHRHDEEQVVVEQHHSCKEAHYLGQIPWYKDRERGENPNFVCETKRFTYSMPFDGLRAEHQEILSFNFDGLPFKAASCFSQKGFCLVPGVPAQTGIMNIYAATKSGKKCLIGMKEISKVPTQAQIREACK